MKKIAVFASGAGTNTARIIDYFSSSETAQVAVIVCNNAAAGVLGIAAAKNIPSLVIEKERFFRGDAYLPLLKEHKIDLIILAGFLWKIPAELINAYPRKIINIHPALLPKFGGKGMYGHHVHSSVIAGKENESGITIHYVDEHYDNGDIILQVKCPVVETDTAVSLAHRVHLLEHEWYPKIIERIIDGIPGSGAL